MIELIKQVAIPSSLGLSSSLIGLILNPKDIMVAIPSSLGLSSSRFVEVISDLGDEVSQSLLH